MPKYNGHRNYNAWNVSLWINGNEGFYNMAKSYVRSSRYTRDEAAEAMLQELHEMGIYYTGDGVQYTKTNIRLAMVDM